MSNPLNEFLEEYGQPEKTAFDWGRAASGAGNAAISGAAVTGMSAVIGGGAVAATKIFNAATKARDFRNMMQYNPDLQEHHDRDPRMFNQMFTSLRSMNPAYSKDPLIAGTYMRQMVDSPMTAGGKLTETLGTRDKFPSTLGRAAEEGMGTAKGTFIESMKRRQ